MTRSASILGSAAIAALIGAIAVSTIANGAPAPSTPEEQATTEALNRKIAEGNIAVEAKTKADQAQYQEQMKRYEDQKRAYDQKKAEYDAQLKNDQGSTLKLRWSVRSGGFHPPEQVPPTTPWSRRNVSSA